MCKKMLESHLLNKTFFKFLLVGIANTLVGAGLMFLLYNFAGGILSYFLNKYFTFQNHQKSVKQIFFFILNLVVCYFFAYSLAKKMCYINVAQFLVLSKLHPSWLELFLDRTSCCYCGRNNRGFRRCLMFRHYLLLPYYPKEL